MRLFLFILCLPVFGISQKEVRQADFTTQALPDGTVQFKPIEPQLSQIAGGNQAYYSYFWEFGDGDFSREESPTHHFNSDGPVEPFLHLTAHYDDGDPPRGKRKDMMAQGGGASPAKFASLFENDESRDPAIRIISNRQARPNEELTLVLGYKNKGRNTTSGNLHLFFNEKVYPTEHFQLTDTREHFGERRSSEMIGAVPMMDFGGYMGHAGDASWIYPTPPPNYDNLLEKQRDKYRTEELWRFTDLEPDAHRNIFISLLANPNMLRDTSAIIYMTGLYLPDDPTQRAGEYVFEIEIVNGHDPNAIAVSDVRINYRFIQFKKLDYKVRFQNDGDGVADSITILIEQPKNLFKADILPQSWSPDCPPCAKVEAGKSCMETKQQGDSLLFIFHNIYLPGSKQKGVTDKDSTKGYVEYRIKPERNMPKYDFKSRAHIYFDKEDPVLTNYTNTRFKKGLSPGPKAGYGFTFEEENSGYFFLGASFAPFKSWKAYPQIELLTGLKGQSEYTITIMSDTMSTSYPNGFDTVGITSGIIHGQTGFVTLDIPISIRKSLSKWFAIGVGLNTQFKFNNGTETNDLRIDYFSREQFPNAPLETTNLSSIDLSTQSLKSRELRFSPFIDLNFGTVRHGPNVGIRTGYPIGEKNAKLWMQLSFEIKL